VSPVVASFEVFDMNHRVTRRRFLAAVPPSLLLVSLRAEERPMPNAADAVAAANIAFGTDLYKLLGKAEGNQFVSPFSISTALAMTAAGAKGATLTAMLKTLHLGDDSAKVDRGFAELLPKINGVGIEEAKRGYALSTSNNLWAQAGLPWADEFKTRVRTAYAAGIHNVDFARATEAARTTINDAVAKETRGKIRELISKDVVTTETRLILTNAVYFKGDWLEPFEKRRTQDADFTALDGKKTKVPLMHQTVSVSYTDTEAFQAVRLPYAGRQTAMTIVLPRKPDGLKAVESMLSAGFFESLSAKLKLSGEVNVLLPRFKIEASYELAKPLGELGMMTAFSPQADFSGMSAAEQLSISEVVHKTYVDVNEVDTEAAAATGVLMRPTSAPIDPPKLFRADRPFLFFIDHLPTKSMLFLGRYAKPV